MNNGALLFDLYGTLIDIETDEGMDSIYDGIARFLNYNGIFLSSDQVCREYYAIMKDQARASRETHPEIDVLRIWRAFILRHGPRGIEQDSGLPLTLARLYRALSRKRLQLYSGVAEVMRELSSRFPLALISDAQACFAWPEMNALNLTECFEVAVISCEKGFRKPDERMFTLALNALQIMPSQAVMIGNDMYRDIYGASKVGLRTVFFRSNQGKMEHPDTNPTATVTRFEDIPKVLANMGF